MCLYTRISFLAEFSVVVQPMEPHQIRGGHAPQQSSGEGILVGLAVAIGLLFAIFIGVPAGWYFGNLMAGRFRT